MNDEVTADRDVCRDRSLSPAIDFFIEDKGQKDNAASHNNILISFPRILFISPTGLVDTDITNEEGSTQHKYFYSKPEQIAKSMKKVLDKYAEEQFDV